ncbi:MAG: hypothetical protein AAF733_09235 [Verrucomicrobiota bacterium]
MMKTPVFACLLLAFSAALFSEESLEFTGSFWDTADSFRLSVVIEGESVELVWDGYPDNRIDREKGSPGRITYDLACTPAEAREMKRLVDGFRLSHPGFRMLIGTGLSVTAAKFLEEDLEYSYSYFSLQSSNHLGQRAENIPLLFQGLISDGDFSDHDRAAFFREVESFSHFLEAYEKALNSLATSQESGSPVQWESVLSFRDGQELAEDLEAERTSQVLGEVQSIISAVLSGPGLEEYFPEGVPGETVIALQNLYSTESNGEYSYPISLSTNGLEGDLENYWIPYPRYLKGFLEDYIHGRWSVRDIQGKLEHPFFEISLLGDKAEINSIQERFRFVENSDYLDFLFEEKGVEATNTGILLIDAITLSADGKQSVVEISGIEKGYTLLEKEASGWKVTRLLDESEYRNHESDWPWRK